MGCLSLKGGYGGRTALLLMMGMVVVAFRDEGLWPGQDLSEIEGSRRPDGERDVGPPKNRHDVRAPTGADRNDSHRCANG